MTHSTAAAHAWLVADTPQACSVRPATLAGNRAAPRRRDYPTRKQARPVGRWLIGLLFDFYEVGRISSPFGSLVLAEFSAFENYGALKTE